MEFFDVVDINRKYINKILPRGTKLDKNEFNVGVEIWFMNSKKQLFITQRSENKSHPLLWECPGGCSIAGENSIQTLNREIQEEIGLNISNLFPCILSTQLYKQQFVDTYLLKIDFEISDLTLQKSEIQNAKWVSLDELENMIQENRIVPAVAERFKKEILTMLSLYNFLS